MSAVQCEIQFAVHVLVLLLPSAMQIVPVPGMWDAGGYAGPFQELYQAVWSHLEGCAVTFKGLHLAPRRAVVWGACKGPIGIDSCFGKFCISFISH